MVIQYRNNSIDSLKGFLIFLVVLGHVLLGSLDDNPLRYLIYSFHMPVFFFISGYLLNVEKLQSNSLKVLLSKYWQRMLKSWLIAWCIYSIYVIVNDFSYLSILRQFYHPYYHLWFIPSLFLYILLAHIVFCNIKSSTLSVSLLLIISLIVFYMAPRDYNLSCFVSLGILLKRMPSVNMRPICQGGGNIIFYYYGDLC